MAARHNAPFQRLRHDLEVVAHGLGAGFAQLEEDMVVGNAGEHSHFVKFHVPGDFEIVHVRPYPSRDAGEAIPAGSAGFDRLAVLGRIHEKFRGLDQPALAAELVQQVVDARDLLDRIGRPGLLTVPEGGVGDEHGIRRAGEHKGVVKLDPADLAVRKDVPVEPGRFGVVQGEGHGGVFLLQQRHQRVSLAGL